MPKRVERAPGWVFGLRRRLAVVEARLATLEKHVLAQPTAPDTPPPLKGGASRVTVAVPGRRETGCWTRLVSRVADAAAKGGKKFAGQFVSRGGTEQVFIGSVLLDVDPDFAKVLIVQPDGQLYEAHVFPRTGPVDYGWADEALPAIAALLAKQPWRPRKDREALGALATGETSPGEPVRALPGPSLEGSALPQAADQAGGPSVLGVNRPQSTPEPPEWTRRALALPAQRIVLRPLPVRIDGREATPEDLAEMYGPIAAAARDAGAPDADPTFSPDAGGVAPPLE